LTVLVEPKTLLVRLLRRDCWPEIFSSRLKQEQQFTTDTGLWVDALRTSALWVEWEVIGKRVCRDFKDEMLIEAAVTAGCHTIIARDRGLTVVEKPFGINLCTPREWLDTLTRPQKRRHR